MSSPSSISASQRRRSLASAGRESRADAQKRLVAELARVGIEGNTRVVDGDAASAIVQTAGELNSQLVVVGATGRTGLQRMLVGSLAEKVARAAPCSVLVVRASPGAIL